MEILKLIWAQDAIWATTLSFVIGIWTAFLPIILLKYKLLKAYLAVHKFDNVCISETYLYSSFPFDDGNLDIPGYIMVRANRPANSKRGGVFMYYKNCLPVKVLYIRFFHEGIAFELQIGDKLCSFISLYRLPNQTNILMILYHF